MSTELEGGSRFKKARSDLKIVVMGNSGTGKTSFCNRWMRDNFSDEYKATNAFVKTSSISGEYPFSGVHEYLYLYAIICLIGGITMKKVCKNNKKAFTLTEMLLVILIILILMSVVGINAALHLTKSRKAASKVGTQVTSMKTDNVKRVASMSKYGFN